MAELGKAAAELLWAGARAVRTQKPDPVCCSRLLPLSAERDGDGTGQRGQQEAAAVHY